ncbi:MAG: PorT family protein [Prevotella sp.]|nr:PorT family protein [Prevotella sp.]
MKKLFVLMAAMVMTMTANAQDAVGTLSLKPMVGMTIANVVGEDADGTDPKLGLIAGGELIYQASEIFALSGGLLYSMQGCAGDGGLKMKLDYVNVPLMGNLYVAKGLALKAGLQLGILTKAKASMKEGGVSADVDVKDAMNSLDLSIPIGISYDINNSFVIEGRYNFGMTKIGKKSYSFMGEHFTDDENNVRNSVIQLTLGYKFAL